MDFTNNLTWDEYGVGRVEVFVPAFSTRAAFDFFTTMDADRQISEKMKAAANAVLSLTPSDIERLKDLLWEEFVFSFVVTDYGFESRPGETEFETFKREFEANDREDVLRQASVDRIQIDAEHDVLNAGIAVICMNTASENYVNVIVKDGRIVDLDDDGTHVPSFDEDEINAQKDRRALMAKALSTEEAGALLGPDGLKI